MKSRISIVSYLLKDIFWRWREQPGNVFTRFTVAYTLVLPSLALLGAFVLIAHNLETRLKRNGIDLMFITEHISPTHSDFALRQNHPRLEPLRKQGHFVQLLQLFSNARTPYSKTARVLEYPDSALQGLTGIIEIDAPIIYLSTSFPEGMPMHIEIDSYFFDAVVKRPTGMLDKFLQADAVLLPEGSLPRVESRGYSRITLFKANKIPQLKPLQDALCQVADLDEKNVFIRSSLKLISDLNQLESQQLLWRFGLAVSAGGVLALVLGTLAVLEYRERAYIIALLRSFGVKCRLVYGFQLLENALIVNTAGSAAFASLLYIQHILYKTFSKSGGIAGSLSIEQMSTELLLIFICINIGVLLSTLPSLHVLRKDIGTILS
jgi:hypothetical protein